eukprot:3016745-Pyramimonas_sp.AAC.1
MKEAGVYDETKDDVKKQDLEGLDDWKDSSEDASKKHNKSTGSSSGDSRTPGTWTMDNPEPA